MKISEFIFVISLVLKFNKSYKVSIFATQIVPALTRENSVSLRCSVIRSLVFDVSFKIFLHTIFFVDFPETNHM